MNMRTRSKLLLAALAAALLLTALVGSASANRLSGNEKNFRITYTPMRFESREGKTVSCNVTLEGSFHERTITKTANALVGYITAARVESCTPTNGARANTETLPWHIQYESFTAASGLPNIETITENTINSSFEVAETIFGFTVRCRYTVASEPGINHREARGVITSQEIGNAFTRPRPAAAPKAESKRETASRRRPAAATSPLP